MTDGNGVKPLTTVFTTVCTLALAWQVFDDAPIAVAANRDEALERSAEPPRLYAERPTVVAPRDARAGGTWIGVNEHGLVAGITNRWTDVDLAGDRSRGLLVGDVLTCESTSEAVEVVEQTTTEHEYDAFYLVIADREDAVCLEWNGRLERTPFEPGVHVVVNVGFDEQFSIPSERSTAGRRQAENARGVRAALAIDGDERALDGAGQVGASTETVDDWLERAAAVLGDHDYGVCVHGDGFGTRSSSLLAVGGGGTSDRAGAGTNEGGDGVRYAFADGPPCRTSYERVDAVDELDVGSTSRADTDTDTGADPDSERHI